MVAARPRIAILASGEGTTAEAFIRASAEGRIEPEVELVIVSKPTAGIMKRVKKLNQEYGLNIQVVHIGKNSHPSTEDEELSPGQQTAAEEAAILKALKDGNFDAIALMGYMKKIGPSLVGEFGWRSGYTSPYQAKLINTHPGLLPETKGLYGIYVQEHVLANGLPRAGQTLHVVAEDYDEGPVIVEHAIDVLPLQSADQLFERVKELEKKHLPLDIDNFIKQRKLYGRTDG